MRRRKFLAGAGALGAIPALGKTGLADDRSAPATATPERHSDLPAKFTPCAYATTKTGYSPFTIPDYYTFADDLAIERNAPGKPHAGKVLAAVQAHFDDIPLFAGGTVAKLIDEGYTGYLIRILQRRGFRKHPGAWRRPERNRQSRTPRSNSDARRPSRSTTAITAWTMAPSSNCARG